MLSDGVSAFAENQLGDPVGSIVSFNWQVIGAILRKILSKYLERKKSVKKNQ